MIKSLEDVCLHHEIAMKKRMNVVYNNYGINSIQGYEDKGCYTCDGYRSVCDAYLTKEMLCGGDKYDFQ